MGRGSRHWATGSPGVQSGQPGVGVTTVQRVGTGLGVGRGVAVGQFQTAFMAGTSPAPAPPGPKAQASAGSASPASSSRRTAGIAGAGDPERGATGAGLTAGPSR